MDFREEQWRARPVSTHLDTEARATHHSPQSCREVAIEAMDENQSLCQCTCALFNSVNSIPLHVESFNNP